jgi:hypothetical protein
MSAAVLFPWAINVKISRSTAAASVSETRAAHRSFTIFIGVIGSLAFFICVFDMIPPKNRI